MARHDMQDFPVTPDTSRAFRDVLGHFATGVVVVTAKGPRGPVGITANSFTSVSLDPPLVLWCAAKRSERYESFLAAGHYAVHVLAADQLAMCRHFARSGDDFSPFAPDETPEGLPALPGCLARIDCAAEARHDGGDHAILIGRVLRATLREGDPLLFWRGRYGDFIHHG
ncbi:MAG: flavin reductase family protein [Rhodobacteraceae bacterium]|uniref:flavin reductase family protein n=1 Tax=Albidovulum sp. TaxID=1872424 RepID=UPI001D22A7B2|nr:flavin reductase family protein [Paracoccaceae bacterium]MCC0046626.1 flavin reductase family protein [Defluviimonas sp.]HPE25223.1 flavin reductase family protein [Albidovulum sp.]MCB2131214.1 flavin reductase family protein [Paracoccaceae bacterium]MCB2143753.1 flavin reductase family protein [Paracoccaceae bacterium]